LLLNPCKDSINSHQRSHYPRNHLPIRTGPEDIDGRNGQLEYPSRSLSILHIEHRHTGRNEGIHSVSNTHVAHRQPADQIGEESL
jgi:hypothetical protein